MKRIQTTIEHEDDRGKLINIFKTGEWKEMNLQTIKAGTTRGGHYHKETKELFLYLDGENDLTIKNLETGREETIRCRAGDAVISEPYEVHTNHAVTDVRLIALLTIPYNPDNPDVFRE